MIVVACTSCAHAIRVIGEPQEVDQLIGRSSDFWGSYRCVLCKGEAHGMLEVEADPAALSTMTLVDLTPTEAFIAFNGLGMPTERECRREVIEELFKTPIRKIVGQETKTNRFILEHIEFWDGTRLYLGAAPGGAIIYKISAPPNYMKEALRE